MAAIEVVDRSGTKITFPLGTSFQITDGGLEIFNDGGRLVGAYHPMAWSHVAQAES